MTKIELPCIVNSLNRVLNDAKTHWSKYYRAQKSIVAGLTLYIQGQGIEPITEYPVKIVTRYYLKNARMDPDNIVATRKFWLDALVKAGVLAGDSQKYIAPPFVDYWEVDKINPRIIVTIG